MTAFKIESALPTGTTVLEASAGTGKTYTIAALAARYIAEGVVELSELMVITFGRMATNELRMRVRERLVDVERSLARRLHSPDAPTDVTVVDHDIVDHGVVDHGVVDHDRDDHDDLSRLLLTGSDDELLARHRRVRAALAEFDAATIATTHEFCQTMLDELGVLGDHEPDATFIDSLTDLTHEVATDCYLQQFAADQTPPPFDFKEATQIAADVISAETVPLIPVPVDPSSKIEAAQRYAFARDVREQLEARKSRRRLYSYSDMLTRLRDTLIDPVRGPAAVARLRQRYAVVLVDEFQDTDPVQWQILRTAFAGHATLILIGDPKQAIYAFRGADVYSYLDAVRESDSVGTLDVNWRSDSDLVRALDLMMGGVSLGDRQITVRPVVAHHRQRRLLPNQDQLQDQLGCRKSTDLAPVRIRFRQHHPEDDQPPSVREVRPQVTADLVADITALLASRALLTTPAPDGSATSRPVRPADLAVLVRRNERAEEIRTALTAAGVPAVVLGAGSVYSGPMAAEWLTLLNALERPRQSQVRAVALTVFVGWTMHDLATADEDSIIELSAQIRRWSRLLEHRGVAALIEAITTERDLSRRLLASVGGERRLTDIRHVGQSLHAAMSAGQLGIGALIDWLRQRIDEARSTGQDDRSRRLETDAEAVQILTIHRSKGLQFPIVYLPDAWDRYVPGKDEGRLLRLHDPDTRLPSGEPADGAAADRSVGSAGPLVLDVGGLGGPGRKERRARFRAEDDGEDLRLAYVAFTRAMTQVVTWWMPSANTPCSALQRFLYRSQSGSVADADGIAELAERYELGADPDLLGLPNELFSVEEITPRAATDWRPEPAALARLDRRRFDRDLDQDWRRTSYSALTAAAHGSETAAAGVGSEVEPIKEDDETAASESLTEIGIRSGVGAEPGEEQTGAVAIGSVASADVLVSPMDALPMGASFGTVVHAVLERVDPQTDDLNSQLQRLAAEELAKLPAGPMTAAALAAALEPSLTTPLGPLADDRRLIDFPPTDRLAELTFELPLAGGDQPRADVRLGDIGRLLAGHLPDGDPLADYPSLLADPTLADQPLRGYLNGSIDAVLRIGGAQPRYLVVDYKTNWLGEVDQRPLHVARYAPSRLPEAMMRAHYPLQALLYSAALHRYLRWRQPGYDPRLHLGGTLYLFLRGMAGSHTPRERGVPCGVFSWLPPADLIIGLSDLLDGSRTPATAVSAGGVK